jgi:hypothetical protein
MTHRRHRLAARFLAIGLLAATLSVVDSLTFPDTAEARCTGQGNPVRSTFSWDGNVQVSETPGAGTCNGNNIYTGVLKDEQPYDPECVRVRFKEAGMPDWETPAGGTTCGGTSTFQWRDRNGNSRVYQQFCIYNSLTGFSACGWGIYISSSFYGTNHGY